MGTVLCQDTKITAREIVFLFDRLLLIDKHVISQGRKEQLSVGVLYSTTKRKPSSFNIAVDFIVVVIISCRLDG